MRVRNEAEATDSKERGRNNFPIWDRLFNRYAIGVRTKRRLAINRAVRDPSFRRRLSLLSLCVFAFRRLAMTPFEHPY